MNEEDVRMKLINPALDAAGWRGGQIRPEYAFTDGQVIVQGKRVSRGSRKRADYLLTRRGNDFPLAVIEAKDSQHFSKTRPMLLEHFAECEAWWEGRREIKDKGTDTFKVKAYSAEELAVRSYDFDLCGYPTESEEVLSPEETIRAFHERRARLNAKIDRQIEKITALLERR